MHKEQTVILIKGLDICRKTYLAMKGMHMHMHMHMNESKPIQSIRIFEHKDENAQSTL